MVLPVSFEAFKTFYWSSLVQRGIAFLLDEQNTKTFDVKGFKNEI